MSRHPAELNDLPTPIGFDGRDWVAVAAFGLGMAVAGQQLDHGGPEASAHMLMAPIDGAAFLFLLVLRRGSRHGAIVYAVAEVLCYSAVFALFSTGVVYATGALRYAPLIGVATAIVLVFAAIRQQRWPSRS